MVGQVFISGSDFYYEIFQTNEHFYEFWLCNSKYGIKDFAGGYEFMTSEDLLNYCTENFEADKDYYLYDFCDLR